MIRKIEIENHTGRDLYFSEPEFRGIENSKDHIATIHIREEPQDNSAKVPSPDGIEFTIYHAGSHQKIDPSHDGIKWAN